MALTRGVNRVETAEPMRPGEINVGLAGEFFSTTGLFERGDSNTRHAQQLLIAAGLLWGVELGASWSMSSNENPSFGEQADRSGGDPTFSVKYTRGVAERLRLGALLSLQVPTSPQGDGFKPSAMTASLGALASYRVARPVTLAMNVGYDVDRSRDLFARPLTPAQQFTAGVSKVDALTYGLGGTGIAGLSDSVALGGFAEVAGAFAPSVGMSDSPVRASGGVKAFFLEHRRLEVVVGADVRLTGAPTETQEFPGLPPWQAFARVIGHLGPPPDIEAPPAPPPLPEPEPEPDSDGDGITDPHDPCPTAAENVNGIEDDDGCPDNEAVRGGDTDKDGVTDDLDKCPLEAEDDDGHEDDDGCTDLDDDTDGIPDFDDQCPNEKETINGTDDWDGCPDQGEAQTEYIENVKIEIKTTIHFQAGNAVILDISKPLLDQVALQILAHPEVRLVRVEGHTDAQGTSRENLDLSHDRAISVRRYLLSRGVPPERVEAIGYGEERPVSNNNTAKGRSLNRRVEFVIVD